MTIFFPSLYFCLLKLCVNAADCVATHPTYIWVTYRISLSDCANGSKQFAARSKVYVILHIYALCVHECYSITWCLSNYYINVVTKSTHILINKFASSPRLKLLFVGATNCAFLCKHKYAVAFRHSCSNILQIKDVF